MLELLTKLWNKQKREIPDKINNIVFLNRTIALAKIYCDDDVVEKAMIEYFKEYLKYGTDHNEPSEMKKGMTNHEYISGFLKRLQKSD